MEVESQLKTLKEKSDTYSHLICWSLDGESIVIKDKEQVVEKVLPNLFNHKNFSSFIKQLHMYNFKKVKAYGQLCCYANPNFKKGQRNLLNAISRKKQSKAAGETHVQISPDQDKLKRLEMENTLCKRKEQSVRIQLQEAQIQIRHLQIRNRLLEERIINRVPKIQHFENLNGLPSYDSMIDISGESFPPQQQRGFTSLPSNQDQNFHSFELRKILSTHDEFAGNNIMEYCNSYDFHHEITNASDPIGLSRSSTMSNFPSMPLQRNSPPSSQQF